MKTNPNNNPKKDILTSKPGVINQKLQSDSTSASFGDENQKLFLENNINNKLNLKNNIINKKNMELQNINDDIFPKERQGGSSNYFSTELNMYGNIQINSSANSPENTLEKNKDIIFSNDIPEMLLYKYNYDMALYNESLKDIEYEVEWMYDFLNMGKCTKNQNDPNEIKLCLKNLLNHHKEKKYDIPYIIANCEDIYKKFFRHNEVLDILSVYEVEFLRLQKKRKKILNSYEYVQKKKGDWGLGQEIDKYYLPKKYILEAKTDLELDLIEALLGILTYVSQSNELDENYKNMINVEILKNLNIDYSLLNKVKDDKLDEIIKQFCLYPEQVVHNLKVAKGEINDKIIEPPFPGCPLNDLCKKSLIETAGKYASTKDILMASFQYYNLILSLNPYIFNLIYKKYYDIYTLSTEPTEKGKEILNSLHPSYHCKRIDKMPINYFFEEKNESPCNLYTKKFGEIFLDIEKCANTGLIKYALNMPETPEEIKDLKSSLSKAINGLSDKMEIEGNIITNPNHDILLKKYNGARNLCLENLLIISKGFFLNVIKTKLHNYSEKALIKNISSEFFKIISRNFTGNIPLDNSTIFSIIFNNEKNYFKVIVLSPHFKILKEKELYYVWKGDNYIERDLEITINSSEEQAQFATLLSQFTPRAIIIDVSNLESYKMINFLRSKFHDINLIYSDYNSIIYKLKPYQMTLEQEMKSAIEQVKYVINPVNQIIDLWRYKYEDNLLLNLSLHPLQDSIKDIPLLCYSLENQVIYVINSKGIWLKDLFKYSKNIFYFISGFGPSTSSFIIQNLKNFDELRNSLRKNCANIYNHIELFFYENKINQYGLYKIIRGNDEIGLKKIEVFSAMIKDKIYFKKFCLCNAIVNRVDYTNNLIYCYLLRGENTIKAILPFDYVDPYNKDYQKYFYPQRIILCKIKNIILRHNSYEVVLSNKNDDLISVKDFFDEQNQNNNKIDQKYAKIEQDDFIIKEIQRLKEIQAIYGEKMTDKDKNNNTDKTENKKKLKYSLISLENEQFLKNVTYNNMKKIRTMEYIIRPSFRGENYLILSFYLIDDIYLNYDIEIITKKEENEESNNTITEYKLGNNTYNSLTDIVNKFASKMKNTIENFRKNDYFKKPEEIRELYTKIFGIENPMNLSKDKNKIGIKNKRKEIENENIKTNVMNVIILGFLKEEPDYGIILTKTNDEINYTIDFVKFMHNGYLFHGVLYMNLNEIIFFLKEKRKTTQYQNFLKSQFICTTHQQIVEIDEQYTEFEGIDPNLEKYNSVFNYNDLNNLKSNLLTNDFDNNSSSKVLLGKKRNHDDGWGSENMNENNNDNGQENVWGKGENNEDAWGNIAENKDNNDGWGSPSENKNNNDGWGNPSENKNNNDGWGDNQIQQNKDNPWGIADNSENNNNKKNNNSGWNDNTQNNTWASDNNNNNNSKNGNWNNNKNNNKWQNNNFKNNKKSYSNDNNKKYGNHKNNGYNNKYNNKNKNNSGWNNKDKPKQEVNFDWSNNNNEQENDNWGSGNNESNNNKTNYESSDVWGKNNNSNDNKDTNDNWGSSNNNNSNDNWGSNDNTKNDGWNNTNNNEDGWPVDDTNKNNENDPWGESKENNDKNNIKSSFNSWGGNEINISNDNNNNNDNSWADNNKKNNFNSGNRNNNFHKSNSGKRSFSNNNRNNNYNKNNNNFGNKKDNYNNKGGYSSNWGSNNFQNNKNKFGAKNFKGKKNDKKWANELYKTSGDVDIKHEKDEGEVVDFENFQGFGGYDTKNDNQEQ